MKSWLESLNDDTPKQFNVNGDKPEPILTNYKVNVKGSEILKGRFMLSSETWVEIDLSILDGYVIYPDKYYEVTGQTQTTIQ